MRFIVRHLRVPTMLIALAAVGIAACDDAESGRPASEINQGSRPLSPTAAEQVRARIIEGARRDFQAAAGIHPGFADCFIPRFTRELTRERLAELAATYRADGEAEAAQALNSLGVRSGDACGGRRWVPQLSEAAAGLGSPALAEVSQRPPAWAVKTACPKEIRIRPQPSCKLISRRVTFTDCRAATVGHDVRVSGVSCREAYGLLSPLGGAAGFGSYNRSRQKLTRPAVAIYSAPFEVRDTGWTCWADFDTDRSYAIQYVCWRGSDVLTFRFS